MGEEWGRRGGECTALSRMFSTMDVWSLVPTAICMSGEKSVANGPIDLLPIKDDR